MKYQLPEDLTRHSFYCEKAQNLTTYRSCKQYCHDTFRPCWEQHLRDDLARDCAIENERNARKFVTCSKCGATCDIGLGFNRFQCCECGNIEYCDSEQQKMLMVDEYVEVDEQGLSQAI